MYVVVVLFVVYKNTVFGGQTMFRLAILILTWWLMTGGTGGEQISKQVLLPGTPAEIRAEPEEETGVVTVRVELPKVISHIDCPPPRKARQARLPAD